MQFAAPGTDTEVLDGANHVVEAHEIGTPEKTENERAEERANEALDGLLRVRPGRDVPDEARVRRAQLGHAFLDARAGLGGAARAAVRVDDDIEGDCRLGADTAGETGG